jgi:hypothetical protein
MKPWKQGEDEFSIYVEDADGHIVADVREPPAGSEQTIVERMRLHRERAQLIAAAPEMLVALTAIARYTGEGPGTTPWRDIVRHLGETARAATEKADPRHASRQDCACGDCPRCRFKAPQYSQLPTVEHMTSEIRAATEDLRKVASSDVGTVAGPGCDIGPSDRQMLVENIAKIKAQSSKVGIACVKHDHLGSTVRFLRGLRQKIEREV